jgi:hypothetical protein
VTRHGSTGGVDRRRKVQALHTAARRESEALPSGMLVEHATHTGVAVRVDADIDLDHALADARSRRKKARAAPCHGAQDRTVR